MERLGQTDVDAWVKIRTADGNVAGGVAFGMGRCVSARQGLSVGFLKTYECGVAPHGLRLRVVVSITLCPCPLEQLQQRRPQRWQLL